MSGTHECIQTGHVMRRTEVEFLGEIKIPQELRSCRYYYTLLQRTCSQCRVKRVSSSEETCPTSCLPFAFPFNTCMYCHNSLNAVKKSSSTVRAMCFYVQQWEQNLCSTYKDAFVWGSPQCNTLHMHFPNPSSERLSTVGRRLLWSAPPPPPHLRLGLDKNQ